MTPEIVFIVLNSAMKPRIVCELAEKSYLNGKRVVIYAQSEAVCKQIDSLLWTWKQHSFVPHTYIDSLDSALIEPIVLTTNIDTPEGYDTILLVDPVPLEEVKKFNTVIEFAEKYDSHALQLSRKRYKLYRDHEFNIDTMQPGEYLHFSPSNAP
jgi:DNA polymerase-3 subunit chi